MFTKRSDSKSFKVMGAFIGKSRVGTERPQKIMGKIIGKIMGEIMGEM